jgi:lysophospholipase L1-like esterase
LVRVIGRTGARLRCLGLVLAVVGVVLTGFASPAAAERRYTALGDSYTSGPVIPNQIPDPPGCLRSDHNYPHLTAAALKLSLTDVSCGGATTRDMTSAQQTSAGTNPPQLSAVRSDTTDVTLGIGGNDIGFSSIIEDCTALSPFGPVQAGGAPYQYQSCQAYYNRNGSDELAQRIADTQPKVEDVLARIRAKAPGARVYVVDYPAILPTEDVTPDSKLQCWPEMAVTYEDIPYLRATQERLNAMLATAAANAGASFIATYPRSVDHNACVEPETNRTRYIEPMAPTRPAAPVHPNADGEAYMATVVRGAMRK